MQILICTVLLDKRVVYLGKHIISLIRESVVHLRKPFAQTGLHTVRLCGLSSLISTPLGPFSRLSWRRSHYLLGL